MHRYVIREICKEMYHAGSKATRDCAEILLRKDFQPIDMYNYQGKTGIGDKLKKRVQLIRLLKIKSKSIVVIPHPMYIGALYIEMLKIVKVLKRIKIIFVIHDLESLRGMFKEQEFVFGFLDDAMLKFGDVFIAHNEKMKQYLVEERKISENKIVVLGLFDYLSEKRNLYKERKVENIEIVIAGNLSPQKSGYIYKLRESNTELKFSLYGLNYEQANTQIKNWNYKGVFPPSELVSVLQGDYGLVWDGDELASCVGSTGDYLKYNNPHKASLYIAAELPVVIWNESALADYVIAKKIGIGIDSLERLEETINAVSREEYMQMKENIKIIAKKVRNGEFFEEAYEKAESKVRSYYANKN